MANTPPAYKRWDHITRWVCSTGRSNVTLNSLFLMAHLWIIAINYFTISQGTVGWKMVPKDMYPNLPENSNILAQDVWRYD